MKQPALLALEDGTVLHGSSIGIAGQAVGEVVFNTAITGYQEILTDPSYFKQIVTLTQPHIGNVGVNPPLPMPADWLSVICHLQSATGGLKNPCRIISGAARWWRLPILIRGV